MLPVSIEEQIICYADKFFSKGKSPGSDEKPRAAIMAELERCGR